MDINVKDVVASTKVFKRQYESLVKLIDLVDQLDNLDIMLKDRSKQVEDTTSELNVMRKKFAIEQSKLASAIEQRERAEERALIKKKQVDDDMLQLVADASALAAEERKSQVAAVKAEVRAEKAKLADLKIAVEEETKILEAARVQIHNIKKALNND